MKMEYGPFKSLPCPPRHKILSIWNEMKRTHFTVQIYSWMLDLTMCTTLLSYVLLEIQAYIY